MAVVVGQVAVDVVEQPPVTFVKAATDLHNKMRTAAALAVAAHQLVALVVRFPSNELDC